jgi:hypothetical protein
MEDSARSEPPIELVRYDVSNFVAVLVPDLEGLN